MIHWYFDKNREYVEKNTFKITFFFNFLLFDICSNFFKLFTMWARPSAAVTHYGKLPYFQLTKDSLASFCWLVAGLDLLNVFFFMWQLGENYSKILDILSRYVLGISQKTLALYRLSGRSFSFWYTRRNLLSSLNWISQFNDFFSCLPSKQNQNRWNIKLLMWNSYKYRYVHLVLSCLSFFSRRDSK